MNEQEKAIMSMQQQLGNIQNQQQYAAQNYAQLGGLGGLWLQTSPKPNKRKHTRIPGLAAHILWFTFAPATRRLYGSYHERIFQGIR